MDVVDSGIAQPPLHLVAIEVWASTRTRQRAHVGQQVDPLLVQRAQELRFRAGPVPDRPHISAGQVADRSRTNRRRLIHHGSG
jgi:hypothetical protein